MRMKLGRSFSAVFAAVLWFSGFNLFGAQENYQFRQPEGLAFDSADHLFIADRGNNVIVEFDENLQMVRKIGAEGSEPGQFREPTDVAFDSQKRMIVADSGNNRIEVFGREGKYLFSFGKVGEGAGEFNRCWNVAVDDKDNIIVSDRFNHRLQVFDPKGNHLFTLSNRQGQKDTARIEKEKKWAIQREPTKRIEDVIINPQWERTDTGQLNEPGGVWLDVKAKELWIANGWNCRSERFGYDSATGTISRKENEAIEGIVWGPWVCRSCAGTSDGKYMHLSSPFGIIQVFNDRAKLNANSKIDRETTGRAYGNLKDIGDIAINSKGQIASADTGNNRIVIFEKDFEMPAQPYVEKINEDGAEISWQTKEKCETEVMIRKGDLPERTSGQENPWQQAGKVKTISLGKDKVTNHKAILTGLEAGTKYFYKVRMPQVRILPGAGWSREYAFITHAGKGRCVFVRTTVKMLLMPNVVDVSTVRKESTFPENMSGGDIKRYYADQFEQTRLFYWVNSRMKYFIDEDLYIDRVMYRMGDINAGQFKDEAEKKRYEALPQLNPDVSLSEQLKKAGRDKKIYFGQVHCVCERFWDEGAKRWEYRGSGGGTYGIEWPLPGRSNFLGGSDVAWLYAHEYKHQVESNYDSSGLEREDERMWFCHFAPVHTGWDKQTAADHGEHWDGIAWQLRHHRSDSYLRAIYCFAQTAIDADEDGIPDDSPRLPLDEKKLGSDVSKKDSDADGLSDMNEVLSSTWVKALNLPVRSRIEVNYIRPKLMEKDSDSDGLEDGKDKYPIYPYATEIKKGKVKIDGKMDEWKEKPQIKFTAEGTELEIFSRWSDSNDAAGPEGLFYAGKIKGEFETVDIILDLDADGFYCGNDNLKITMRSEKSNGPQLLDSIIHICGEDRWPFFDDERNYFGKEQLKFSSAKADNQQLFEFAVPKKQKIGLTLKKGEDIGLMIYINLSNGRSLSVFEPYSIFNSSLAEKNFSKELIFSILKSANECLEEYLRRCCVNRDINACWSHFPTGDGLGGHFAF